jgi:hypothetical protein
MGGAIGSINPSRAIFRQIEAGRPERVKDKD